MENFNIAENQLFPEGYDLVVIMARVPSPPPVRVQYHVGKKYPNSKLRI